MKDIIMLTLVEELQPILTRATVMLESRSSNYHSLLQHNYNVRSVDNRRYKKICIVQKNYVFYDTCYIISYVQMKHCLRGAAPTGLLTNIIKQQQSTSIYTNYRVNSPPSALPVIAF